MARALVLDKVPADVQAEKDRDPAKPLVGEEVHDRALFDALERHGTFDRYYYVDAGLPQSPATSSRIEPLSAWTVGELTRIDEVVLFTSSLWLSKYAPMREAMRRLDWPICGVTHSLADLFQLVHFLSLGVCALHDHDAVICSTPGARDTVINIFRTLEQSRSLRRAALQLPPIELPVIPLGVEVDSGPPLDQIEARRQLGLDADGLVFLTVGRLSPVGKADLLPVICSFLANPELPAKSTMLIAGDDTQFHMAAALTQAAAAMSSDKRVRVIPNFTTAQRRALFASADVYLGLSDTFEETFGIAIVEAMLAGLPVVAADWDGFRHLIRDGREGRLIRTLMPTAGTDELSALMNVFPMLRFVFCQRAIIDGEALQKALADLAASPRERRTLGEAGRERAQRLYSWRAVISQYEQLWSSLLERGKARRHSHQHGLPHAAFIDYGAAFAHYPTALLTDDCFVTATGRPFAGPALDMARAYGAWFSAELEQSILEILARTGGTTLGALVAEVAAMGYPEIQVSSEIGRLAKYGLIAPVGALDHSRGDAANHARPVSFERPRS